MRGQNVQISFLGNFAFGLGGKTFAILRGNISFRWIFLPFSYNNYDTIFDHIPGKLFIFCSLSNEPVLLISSSTAINSCRSVYLALLIDRKPSRDSHRGPLLICMVQRDGLVLMRLIRPKRSRLSCNN